MQTGLTMPDSSGPRTGDDKHPKRIAGMFDAIASRYDLLNRLLSAGLDRRWRSRAIEALALTGRETLVDVCTGTADLALAAVDRRCGGAKQAIGIDFSEQMLVQGRDKIRRTRASGAVRLVRGDASRIPIAPEAADAVTVAFGIRNVQDPAAACADMHRVLKPGGRLAVLEFGIPRAPGLRQVYLWYFRRVLPAIGRLVSRHASAYAYLPASVALFPDPAAFAAQLRQAGFSGVDCVHLSFGIVLLYVAQKG